MKIRLADYIADFLANKGVTDCFTVVGGGAMHLNDAFGHHKAPLPQKAMQDSIIRLRYFA